ncbi:hypothetical protein BLOT_016842, partial [Blomia tropicalis]
MDKLYDYEVVEVFLLGSNEHYLEVELGPRGQYLLNLPPDVNLVNNQHT